MVKLTAELIGRSSYGPNPLQECTLDLRGKGIQEIENLGATRDMFDGLDFTNNSIRSLRNFPRLLRCTTLLAANNQISSISPEFGVALPNLRILMITANQV